MWAIMGKIHMVVCFTLTVQPVFMVILNVPSLKDTCCKLPVLNPLKGIKVLF
jgi:hypothetical protein